MEPLRAAYVSHPQRIVRRRQRRSSGRHQFFRRDCARTIATLGGSLPHVKCDDILRRLSILFASQLRVGGASWGGVRMVEVFKINQQRN